MPQPTLPADLLDVFARMDESDEIARLLGDLLTPAEIDVIRERWLVVKLLASGQSQRAVRDTLGVSITTVSRGSRQLKYGNGAFVAAFDLLATLGRRASHGKHDPAADVGLSGDRS
mgnify:CR=1 FL=1